MTHDEFLTSFETCTLPRADWTHKAHVRMAWLYIKRHGFETALKKAREGIQRYNAHNGNLTGYRETETQFFMRLISSRVRTGDSKQDFHDFCEQNPDLFDGSNPPRRKYYSDALWRSPETWTGFVLPDLAQLPEP